MKPKSSIHQNRFHHAAAVLTALTLCQTHAALIAEERFDYADVIPEPSSSLIALFGGFGLLALRRRG